MILVALSVSDYDKYNFFLRSQKASNKIQRQCKTQVATHNMVKKKVTFVFLKKIVWQRTKTQLYTQNIHSRVDGGMRELWKWDAGETN